MLVQQVQPGGPADKAGLKAGDIITTIDGRSIKDGDDLVNEIASRRPGSTIRLGYLRDGKQADTTVTIGDRDKVFADLGDPAGRTQLRTKRATPAKPSWASWSASFRRRPRPSSTFRAAWSIQSVRTGSFADLQGLEPGLVIIRINKQPTGTKGPVRRRR